jgi:septal ring factor EnvC (AmiA/AmiB activator)
MLALVLANLAHGQEPNREIELEELRHEIVDLTYQLRQIRREKGGLAGQLEQTVIALNLQEKRVSEARAARAIAEESLARIENHAVVLEHDLSVKRSELRQRLSALYRLGRQGYLRLILSIRAEQDLLPGIRQLRFLAKRDANLLGRFMETRDELAAERVEILSRQEEVDAWVEQESVRLAQLSRLRQQQRTILARLEREGSKISAETERLRKKEVKLANFLDFLYGRAGTPLSGTPMNRFQGVLDWPVKGKVTTGFGPRLDSRYRTQVPHNGLEITTRPNSEARVVFPGKVLFAAPFQGYGLTAVVNHPGRFFTLYAGLQRLQVKQGDMVSLGAVVGRTGEHLYFELRVENQPVDPREWLR